MAQVATMNQAQLQILDMLSFIKTPEALRDLNKVIFTRDEAGKSECAALMIGGQFYQRVART